MIAAVQSLRKYIGHALDLRKPLSTSDLTLSQKFEDVAGLTNMNIIYVRGARSAYLNRLRRKKSKAKEIVMLDIVNINAVVKLCPICGSGVVYRIDDNTLKVRCSECGYHKEYVMGVNNDSL